VRFDEVTARVGRQELSYGSSRLVSVREGPNVRQSFDAARVMVHRSTWQIDAFGGWVAQTREGIFDDATDDRRALWGAYIVRRLGPRSAQGVDLYYLGYRRRNARFDQGQGTERRHSFGARLWGEPAALDYNVELVAQVGRFDDTGIRAWTVASDTGYRLAVAGQPRLGLRADITSGDRDRTDDRLGTFNPLFPKGAYFGLIATSGPSNHRDVHPQVTVSIGDVATVTTSWLFFWRDQTDDGLYGIPGNLLRSGVGTRSRFVGHSPGIEAEWQLNPHLTMTGNLSAFTAGPFIQESGPASTIGFAAVWATYRF
jgi:alginate export protein